MKVLILQSKFRALSHLCRFDQLLSSDERLSHFKEMFASIKEALQQGQAVMGEVLFKKIIEDGKLVYELLVTILSSESLEK